MLLVVLRFHCPFIAVPFIPVASEHRMELCMQSVALESKQFEALRHCRHYFYVLTDLRTPRAIATFVESKRKKEYRATIRPSL